MAANHTQTVIAEASADGADPSSSDGGRDDRVRPDRDALRRENRRLRSRVYALERALDEHERRRQAVVDQYELVVDGRDRRLDRLTDAVRRDADHEQRVDGAKRTDPEQRIDGAKRTDRDRTRERRVDRENRADCEEQADRTDRSGADDRSTGVLATLRRALASPFR